jgi:hypothetical protein
MMVAVLQQLGTCLFPARDPSFYRPFGSEAVPDVVELSCVSVCAQVVEVLILSKIQLTEYGESISHLHWNIMFDLLHLVIVWSLVFVDLSTRNVQMVVYIC